MQNCLVRIFHKTWSYILSEFLASSYQPFRKIFWHHMHCTHGFAVTYVIVEYLYNLDIINYELGCLSSNTAHSAVSSILNIYMKAKKFMYS